MVLLIALIDIGVSPIERHNVKNKTAKASKKSKIITARITIKRNATGNRKRVTVKRSPASFFQGHQLGQKP